jgi:hypothetical protein
MKGWHRQRKDGSRFRSGPSGPGDACGWRSLVVASLGQYNLTVL